ncbi:MAG: hypothetical protein H6605_03425 [Flavobacteriales bacterium]|nr:hypothetical protein [Flavobacteriales bacterium]
MIKKSLLLILLLGGLMFQNCGDDPVTVPDPITAPSVLLPSISGVDGILLAMNTSTKSNGTETVTGTGYAVFYNNKNVNSKVEAGTLKLNTKDLVKSDDNIYFYTPAATDPKGIIFGSQIFWQGTGNTASGVPAINDNDGSGFPNMPQLSEFVNFQQDQDKTISWVSSTGADSVILVLKGPSSTLRRVFGNDKTSTTLLKDEIAKLGVGSGVLSIINYKRSDKTIGSKTYSFVKESVATTTKVGIQ